MSFVVCESAFYIKVLKVLRASIGVDQAGICHEIVISVIWKFKLMHCSILLQQ